MKIFDQKLAVSKKEEIKKAALDLLKTYINMDKDEFEQYAAKQIKMGLAVIEIESYNLPKNIYHLDVKRFFNLKANEMIQISSFAELKKFYANYGGIDYENNHTYPNPPTSPYYSEVFKDSSWQVVASETSKTTRLEPKPVTTKKRKVNGIKDCLQYSEITINDENIVISFKSLFQTTNFQVSLLHFGILQPGKKNEFLQPTKVVLRENNKNVDTYQFSLSKSQFELLEYDLPETATHAQKFISN